MLFGTMEINNNQLYIGGVSASDLLQKHGSPLYVYDVQHINDMIDCYQTNFTSSLLQTRVAYASKAFLTKAMVRLLQHKQMSLDLVSAGEMVTAKRSGFDMSKTIIHGNNKSELERQLCFDYEVGYIVVDNIFELQDIIELATSRNQTMKTLLRVNPGVEAHTHEYVVTAKLTSKFGESIYDELRIKEIMELYQSQPLVQLTGFHCHIGSQVFDLESYVTTIEVMSTFINKIEHTYHQTITTLNLGGGFGVYYKEGDQPSSIEHIAKTIIRTIEEKIVTNELHINELIIEPGRSIVANAGTTLYTVGYTKQTVGGKHYVFIDGGMTDNIRPALYQAQYDAKVATNMNAEQNQLYTVAGKLCESGDVLINDIMLPTVHKNDILAVFSTGAYTYSMSSNYNRILKPAVVFVENGISEVVVARETFDDLLRNDL